MRYPTTKGRLKTLYKTKHTYTQSWSQKQEFIVNPVSVTTRVETRINAFSKYAIYSLAEPSWLTAQPNI